MLFKALPVLLKSPPTQQWMKMSPTLETLVQQMASWTWESRDHLLAVCPAHVACPLWASLSSPVK